jgi:hypothetical protein
MTVTVGHGCARPRKAEQLVSAVESGLALREAKITSYQFDAETTDAGGRKVNHSFFYRSPNKLRADVGAHLTFTFDGESLFKIDHDRKETMTTSFRGRPKAEAAESVYQTFAPFLPEGWRTPLIAGNVTAQEGPASVAGQSVWLSTEARSDGSRAELRYLFALPGMDWRATESTVDGRQATRRALEDHCDAQLGLCFPKKIETTQNGQIQSTTVLTGVVINGPIPAEMFTLPGSAADPASRISTPGR